MIQYALKCADGHTFDSWFQSATAFEKLVSTGMLSCAVCGNGEIAKAIMAPRVRTGRDELGREELGREELGREDVGRQAADASETNAPTNKARAPSLLSEPSTPAEQAMAELRQKVEANSDYVGKDFASQARAMHDGDVPLRSIYGEANLDEARQLIDDGVPVAPLPFMPARKVN